MPIYLLALLFGAQKFTWCRTHHPRDNAFFVSVGAKIPMFSSISQQPTIGNSSTHGNRLIGCQSIYWSCLLARKNWRWCKIHHLEITHISVPRAGNPMFSQISQQPTVGNSSTHENGVMAQTRKRWNPFAIYLGGT